MELKGRNATWLELAVAPAWRLGQTRVQLHALSGGQNGCFGITVDERWLCANDGRLTVFDCREAAARFLELLRIDHMEDGAPSELPVGDAHDGVQCMRLASGGLRPCDTGRGRKRRTELAPSCWAGQSSPRRVSASSDAMR
jgi:hypothetical protein